MSDFEIIDDINNNIVINVEREEIYNYKFLFLIYLLITIIYYIYA
jgi:hypothetical protein